MLDERPPSATLYRAQLLNAIGGLGVNIEMLVADVSRIPGARFLAYPDGTLQVEGRGIYEAFESRGARCIREYDGQVAFAENPASPRYRFCGSQFHSLPAFAPMHYTVLHWHEHVKRWQGGTYVQAGCTKRFYEIEPSPLDNLMVTLAFHRRFTNAARPALAAHVAEWLAEVGEQGLFGEGKISPRSPTITFYDRVARFYLDASATGQQTINWLILHLMNFWDVHPLEIVYFTTHPSRDISFEEEYALSRQEPIELPLEKSPNASVKKESQWSLPPTQLKVVRYDPDEDDRSL